MLFLFAYCYKEALYINLLNVMRQIVKNHNLQFILVELNMINSVKHENIASNRDIIKNMNIEVVVENERKKE